MFALHISENLQTNRFRVVSVDRVVSKWIEVKLRAHRENVLTPPIFNLYVDNLKGKSSKNAHIGYYADNCLQRRSHKKYNSDVHLPQGNLGKLEEYFPRNWVHFKSRETSFNTFPGQNYKWLNQMETVSVCSTVVKKSGQYKFSGNIVNKHHGFHYRLEKFLGKMTMGIKTVLSVQVSFRQGSQSIVFVLSSQALCSILHYVSIKKVQSRSFHWRNSSSKFLIVYILFLLFSLKWGKMRIWSACVCLLN